MSVIVYSKPGCPQCVWTMRKLAEQGTPFSEVDVTTDEAHTAYVRERTGTDHPTMPYVETDTGWWCGFKIDRIRGLKTIGGQP